MEKHFSIIVAVDQDFGIGKQGSLPWQLPSDMRHFKEITTQGTALEKINMVIMGRRTWESLPEKYRPLPGRINVVVTSNEGIRLPEGVYDAHSLSAALELGMTTLAHRVEAIFVIGGAQIYCQAIQHPLCRTIYMTRIRHSFGCDVFFPQTIDSFKLDYESSVLQDSGMSFYFQKYTRK